jgi:hypothetical protein
LTDLRFRRSLAGPALVRHQRRPAQASTTQHTERSMADRKDDKNIRVDDAGAITTVRI